MFITNLTGGLKRSNFSTPTSFSFLDSFNSNYSANTVSFYNGILSYAAFSAAIVTQNSILNIVRRSTDRGNVGTFATVDTFPFTASAANFVSDGTIKYLVQGSSSAIWSTIAASNVSINNRGFRIRKSSDSGLTYSDYLTGSQFPKVVLNPNAAGGFGCLAVSFNEKADLLMFSSHARSITDVFNNLLYSSGNVSYTSINNSSIYPSSSLFSAKQDDSDYIIYDILIFDDKTILCCGEKGVTNLDSSSTNLYGRGFILKGKLTTNSASLSSLFFGTSYGYANSEILGIVNNQFALSNVSEFPHTSGLFQMKNMVLGTQTAGKIGKSEDSIIQVKHIGSTVKIMWPRQENADSTLYGYGDLSAGSSAGKLTSIFDPGDFIDVTEFDHMSLYCYLQKRSSGTLDDIVIQVERKPIRDIGFATDQVISYSISGSITEARLRDLYYVKAIDYGDLSIREVAWPIDIPLTNTKQVRISAKFKNGQVADQNKNFIVYGRFIKASKDTNET